MTNFAFDSPHKKPYAELRKELDELEARQETWSPVDVARYCLIQDAMQERRRNFKSKIEIVDGGDEEENDPVQE